MFQTLLFIIFTLFFIIVLIIITDNTDNSHHLSLTGSKEWCQGPNTVLLLSFKQLHEANTVASVWELQN